MWKRLSSVLGVFHRPGPENGAYMRGGGDPHFQNRPDDRNECDQWTLVRDGDDREDFVLQEHVKLGLLMSGKPYVRLVRRMTVGEFLITDQPPRVKGKLKDILAARSHLS
jgi:hypothetical protein